MEKFKGLVGWPTDPDFLHGKTDTTAQLYCTLSTKYALYVAPIPISRQNQKLTQQHNWKNQPMRSKCIHLSISHFVCG